MDTLEAILKRRSVRKYKPDPVTDEVLNKVLDAVRWAPSWANVQPTEVIVVRDEEMKKKLQATLSPSNPASKAMLAAPVVVVMCGKKGLSGVYKGTTVTALGDWMLFDVGIAAENLCLAACALGLGTVHAGFLNHNEANKILGLPEDVTVVEYIPLGYPDHAPSAPPRRELAQFVHKDKFGGK